MPKLEPQVPGAKPTPADPPNLAALYGLSPGDLAEKVRDLSDDDLTALKELAPTGDDSQAVRDIVQAEINTRATAPQQSHDLSEVSDGELDRALAAIMAEKARREGNKPPPSYDPDHGKAHPYEHIPASKIDASKLTKAVLSRDGWVMPHKALME